MSLVRLKLAGIFSLATLIFVAVVTLSTASQQASSVQVGGQVSALASTVGPGDTGWS